MKFWLVSVSNQLTLRLLLLPMEPQFNAHYVDTGAYSLKVILLLKGAKLMPFGESEQSRSSRFEAENNLFGSNSNAGDSNGLAGMLITALLLVVGSIISAIWGMITGIDRSVMHS